MDITQWKRASYGPDGEVVFPENVTFGNHDELDIEHRTDSGEFVPWYRVRRAPDEFTAAPRPPTLFRFGDEAVDESFMRDDNTYATSYYRDPDREPPVFTSTSMPGRRVGRSRARRWLRICWRIAVVLGVLLAAALLLGCGDLAGPSECEILRSDTTRMVLRPPGAASEVNPRPGSTIPVRVVYELERCPVRLWPM